ncbi:PspC domain-containing protein [Gordonia sp. zg691]|uniref:PspC domain-containing protein n=1 Tax=Gordonia jinghuaiqii TaxID=2758710 RepID=A0A7D7LS56_9ACTN|nr:PspC domain-containing protein [Gordonia jinghuaiqii]MBD0859868.1 PspC domain-containing protein [Gordonia jinghuaiqii]MCR5977033.1 PspC domain-containing protein [Gordonia jinghuaiqii]QMT00357.1 PspC domain-containing protein [Gordonia jinghuaiqii]
MTSTQPATPRLMRSRSNAWLGGVCGGIAERWGWDPTLVRVLFILSLLLPGPQVLLYLALWIVIPRRPVETTVPTVL